MNESCTKVCGTCERVNNPGEGGEIATLVAGSLGSAAVSGCQNVCPRVAGLVGVRFSDGSSAVGYVAGYGDGGDVPSVGNTRPLQAGDRPKVLK